MSDGTRRLLVLLSTVAAGAAGAWISWLLVAPSVAFEHEHGFISFGAFKFVAAAAIGGAALGLLVSRRLVIGPRLTRLEWLIEMPPIAPQPVGYRELREPSLGALLDRLAARGHRARAEALDELDHPTGPAAPDLPLAGARVRLTREDRGPRGACVLLRLAPRLPDQRVALGFIEVLDIDDGRHARLGAEAICALDDLLPGVCYKRSDSSLSAEPADTLRAQLD
jgi:hypothetical protein